MESHQVAIVGAGPVGLSLALGLARRGRDVLVLEKNEAMSEHSRAPAIWPKTQEVLAGLGAIDAFLAEGLLVPRLQMWDVQRARPLFVAPIEELAGETAYPHLLIVPQSRTEKLLLDALEHQPTAQVRFACEVTEFVQHDSHVEIRVRTPKGDDCIEANFVAGCDGAHSITRKAIGADFEGITYDLQVALADVQLDEPMDVLSPRLVTKPRPAIGIPMPQNLWRMILPLSDREQVTVQQRIDDAAAALFGGRSWQHVWRSEFRIHRRVASSFAQGRIVLAGDAAHLNSPVGGQGMNAGIQDAALLTTAIDAALDQNDTEPLMIYGRDRQQAIRRGVNRFTDILTKLLLSRRGRIIRPMLRLAGMLLRIAPLRRRVLRRLAMLD